MGHHVRYVVYLAIGVVIGIVSIGIGLLYSGIRWAVTAEHAYHANLLVVDLIREYVADHRGTWPRSWQELERLPPREWAMFRWPEDAEVVRRYVWVDFAADPNTLATAPAEQFDAIQPRGPCYPYKNHRKLAELLNVVRQTRHPDGDTPQ